MRTLLKAALLAILLICAACSRNTRSDKEPLAFVPADTPYVFANVEPMPTDVMDGWFKTLEGADGNGKAFTDLYIQMLEQAQASLAEKGQGDSMPAKLMAALADEIRGKSLREINTAVGNNGKSRMALYGIGLVPVWRMDLADPPGFHALIDRIEQKVGESLPTAQLGRMDYWSVPLPDSPLHVIAAEIDGQLILSVAPQNADAGVLERIFGLKRPQRSMADSGDLAALNERMGYTPYATFLLDSQRLADALVREPDDVEQAFFAAFKLEKPKLDEACKTELRGLAARWPRLHSGYDEISANRMSGRFIVEADPETAKALMTLRAPLPGYAAGENSLMNFGLSLNLDNVPGLAAKFAGMIGSAPFTCEALAGLNDFGKKLHEAGSNPGIYAAAPAANSLHLILSKLEWSLAGPPQDFAGKLLIGSKNPASLIAMAKGFLPTLAELDLQPDGVVHPLELPPTPGVPQQPAHIAMTSNALGVSVGAGEEASLAEALVLDDRHQLLFVMGYSGQFYAQLLETVLQKAELAMSEKEREQNRLSLEIMRTMYASLKRVALQVDATETGVVLTYDMTMQ